MKNSGAVARDITRDYTNGWLTKVREGSTSWGTLTYHPNGMLDTVTHLNGVESRYGLDPQKMQRPASVAAVYGATTYWNSGAYAYDGSGNVKAIGADYFYYDGVQRLVEGTSERVSSSVYKRQSQTYDVYGNITNIATTINGSTSNRPIGVDPATNRLNATNYDPAGNQTSWDGIYTYGYDSLGMMVSQQGSNRDILYFYTADDERVWEYDHNANRSDYTIRDLDKKVLRVFDENIGVWIWKKDMIGRGSAALASMSYGGALHYTVDHLGTPRYISDAARAQIGRHAYYPFGQESTSDTQNQEFAKFTGHERDTNFTGTLDYLDYMHARYYNPMLGRFLSVDPLLQVQRAMQMPQQWNRYAYVLNRPLTYTDPTGKDVSIRLNFRGGWDDEEKRKIIAQVTSWYQNQKVGRVYVFDGAKAAHGGHFFSRLFNPGYATMKVTTESAAKSTSSTVYAGNFNSLPARQRLNAISNAIIHETAAHRFHGTYLGAADQLAYARGGLGAQEPQVRQRYGTVADSYIYADPKTRSSFVNGPVPIHPADHFLLRQQVGPHVAVEAPDED